MSRQHQLGSKSEASVCTRAPRPVIRSPRMAALCGTSGFLSFHGSRFGLCLSKEKQVPFRSEGLLRGRMAGNPSSARQKLLLPLSLPRQSCQRVFLEMHPGACFYFGRCRWERVDISSVLRDVAGSRFCGKRLLSRDVVLVPQ